MDLIFSDIHADISGLETILDVVKTPEFCSKYGEFSRILNLGDVLERGIHPQQVLGKLSELAQSYSVESVMGNHDESHIYGKNLVGSSLESMDAHASLDKDDLSFFKENSDGTFGRQQFVDTKNNIMCVHGGPLDPQKIIPKDNLEDIWLYQRT